MKSNSMSVAARLGSCALLATFAGAPLGAAAATTPYPGLNIGGGAGTNSLNGADYTGNGNDVEDRQIAFKGLVGYRLGPAFSMEAQYVDFGTAESGGNSVKAHGVTAGGVFEIPNVHVRPYAKAGALFWDADGEFSGVNRSETGTDFTYGGGLRFILGQHLDLRTEYERFEFTDADVHTISAMLQFNF